MSRYDKKPEDLAQDTKDFLKSDYGKYLVSTIETMATGSLTGVCNLNVEHPERYAAKYSAFKEVLELIHMPLDDSTPSQG